MAVLLPTATLMVLSPNTTLDSHGSAVTYGWAQRGPYAAHVTAGGVTRDATDRTETEAALVVVIAPEAWPVRGADRLLNQTTGEVYEVTGAVRVPNVPGSPSDLSHVRVTAALMAEASRG